MKKRLLITVVAVLTLIGVSSFIYIPKYTRGVAYAKSDEKASSVDERLVYANTRFAFKIFKELMVEDEGKNIFISPLSISTALAMAYNGAGARQRPTWLGHSSSDMGILGM